MRLLIVSTPRSGNTWFRRLLAGALDLAEFAVHRPGELNWAALPERSIVQIHWRPTPDILNICSDFGFQPALIVRHPLDVLISILHFCAFEPQTECWLGGEAGDELTIRGKDPTDPAFDAYAVSPRAAALLSVSAEWMRAGVPHVRYENLVAATESELRAFLNRLSAQPTRKLSGVIDANTLDQARLHSGNSHFWQGKPGIGSQLIQRSLASRIRDVNPGIFEILDYGINDASDLAPDEIRCLWNTLA